MSDLTAPGGRSFKQSPAYDAAHYLAEATFKLRYRGVRMMKTPIDIALMMHLISKLRPRTIIEIGSNRGGCALWYADMIRTRSKDARVISVDIAPPSPKARDKRVTFLTGDARKLGDVLPADLLASLPRPWIVSEDSAHTREVTRAVLDFFDPHLEVGDYFVIEDGGAGEFMGKPLEGGGPNQALHDFLHAAGERYEIDADLCDFFGYNVTGNPNGYVRRVK